MSTTGSTSDQSTAANTDIISLLSGASHGTHLSDEAVVNEIAKCIIGTVPALGVDQIMTQMLILTNELRHNKARARDLKLLNQASVVPAPAQTQKLR